jgi:DNA-binding response OmpR family regulator/tetratricopeptide (TPR) repeat protein
MDWLPIEGGSVDLVRGAVHRHGGETVPLTTREADLLRYLAERPGQVVSRDQLIAEVWGYSDAVVSRACDNAVRRLRIKLEENPSQPVHLLTAHGTGYRFVPLRGEPQAELPAEATPESGPRSVLALGDVVVDLGRQRAETPSGELALSTQEVELLRVLHEAEGAVVDRQTLHRRVWGQGQAAGRALDNAIRRLRTKIEPVPHEPRFLLTHRTGGYSLGVPSPPALPDRRDVLVGRDHDLAAVREALEAARWVVVTGPGGVGKTRVARRIAGERSPAWWVDLSSCSTGQQLELAVASVLDVVLAQQEAGGKGLMADGRRPSAEGGGRLGRVLAGRGPGLLVLDNLEQVAEAASRRISAWLQAAPQLVCLGTSRVRLGLDGEVAIELEPLGPEDATELFLRRVRAVSRRAELGPEEVGELVQRLDGLPLAIELAAARIGALGPRELLLRMDRALDLLARPAADNPRHRSMRQAVASSWELLLPEQQRALSLLARFRQGFSLQDAEGLLGVDAIDLLQSLRDHSLVHGRGQEERPFGVYEAIRVFVDERREALPDGGQQLDLQFVRWMARLGERAHLDTLSLRQHAQEARLQRLAADDLELATDLALRWLQGGDLAVKTALGALPVRLQYGPLAGLDERCQQLLQGAPLDPRERAHLLAARASLVWSMDRSADALALAQQAWAAAFDPETRFVAGRALATSLVDYGRQGEAAALMEELAPDSEALGRPDVAAWMRARAETWGEGDAATAYAHFERAAELAQQTGDVLLAARAIQQLGRFDLVLGRPGSSRRRLEQALAMYEAEGAPSGAVGVGQTLLVTLIVTGDGEALERTGQHLLELGARMGSLVDAATTWAYIASGRVIRGELGPAREALARCRELYAQSPRDVPRRGYSELREAELLLAEGDPASAVATATRARERLASFGDSWNVARADGVLARALAQQGQVQQGLAAGHRAVQAMLAARQGLYALPVCLAQRGQTAVLAGDLELAGQDLQDAREHAERYGLMAPMSEASVEIARLSALLAAARASG